MRLFLLSILAFILTSSCSRDLINQEMHDYIKTKEHDEALYGWWQSCNDSNQYLLFEDKEFKLLYGRITEDGVLTSKHSGHYWYTECERLYIIKDATWKVGSTESFTEYKISEDNLSILMMDSNGEYFIAYTKVINHFQP